MTHPSPAAAPRAEDARALQLRLYREIGISAVAAALRFTVQPTSAALAPRGLDTAARRAENGGARAA